MTAPAALTVAEVAARLGCSPKHVRNLIASGRLAAMPFGFGAVKPRRRVSADELARFLSADESQVGTTPVRRTGSKLPTVPDYV